MFFTTNSRADIRISQYSAIGNLKNNFERANVLIIVYSMADIDQRQKQIVSDEVIAGS